MPRHDSGCPILRAFCEGWDKQNVQWYPTLRKKREGWGTRMLVAGEEETLVGSFRAAFEETFVERLPALEPSLYGVPVINFCFA
jgi:hypothetical protein